MTITEQYVENVQVISAFSAAFLRDVGELINSLGYEMADGDDWLLGFCTQKIEQEIKNSCNVTEVPMGLFNAAKGLIVAEFLTAKIAKGELSGQPLNFEPVLKQLQEGDTNQVFATDSVQSAEQRLNQFIALMNAGRSQFITYRRLKW